jgi:hypothetical protein
MVGNLVLHRRGGIYWHDVEPSLIKIRKLLKKLTRGDRHTNIPQACVSLQGKAILVLNQPTRHENVSFAQLSTTPCRRIHNIGNRWSSAVSFTPWPLHPRGDSPRYTLYRMLDGPQSLPGRDGEKIKYLHCPSRAMNSGHTVGSLVTILNDLSRLHLSLYYRGNRIMKSLYRNNRLTGRNTAFSSTTIELQTLVNTLLTVFVEIPRRHVLYVYS